MIFSAAAVIIKLLISAMIARSRMDLRKRRLQTLMRLGASRNRLCRICMLD